MTLFFLLLVVVAMPFLAALSYRNIKTLEAEETDLQLKKAPVYFQSMVMQGGLAFLATALPKKKNFILDSQRIFLSAPLPHHYVF
jgi:hypothetical protein